jgi:hypothetical protein
MGLGDCITRKPDAERIRRVIAVMSESSSSIPALMVDLPVKFVRWEIGISSSGSGFTHPARNFGRISSSPVGWK